MEKKNQLAATGLHRIALAQILVVLGFVLSAVMAVMNLSEGMSGAATGVGIVALIVMLAAFVVNIVGMFNAAKADKLFLLALLFTVVKMALTYIHTPAFDTNSAGVAVCQSAAGLIAVVLICAGAGKLLKAANEEAAAKLGYFIMALYAVVSVIYTAVDLMTSMQENIGLAILLVLLACQTVGALAYFVFLNKASKALGEH